MKKILISLLVTLCLTLVTNVHAQSLKKPASTDTASVQSDTPEKNKRSQTSGRIIPPEKFGEYKKKEDVQNDISQEALIEKLRADSASMKIRFDEKMRQLRSDSEAMRKTIQRLRNKVAQLKSDTCDCEQKMATKSDKTSSTSNETGNEFRSKDEKNGTDTEKLSPETRLNPNTASLEELKSISELSSRLAERIEWYRREVAPFEDAQDITKVPGIDRQTFKQIKKYFHEGPY